MLLALLAMLVEPEVPQKLPFLEAICWQTTDVKHFTSFEMLSRYERGWHYRGVLGEPSSEELQFIKQLVQCHGSWLATMFDRKFHRKIITVLDHLNADFLDNCRAYFGGGTLISLRHGEHRLSKDIDFMCPLGQGYRLLRQEVADKGYNAIFASLDNIILTSEIQANQYGVRFPVTVDGTPIKFEIVVEGRIQLGNPDYLSWSSVPCLNETDSFAEKLLANSDRWLDASVESRDLIALAVLRLASPIPAEAIAKAENAYPVIEPLKRAIRNFQQQPDYREECFKSLMVNAPETIIDGLDLLAFDFGIEPTTRTLIESRWEHL